MLKAALIVLALYAIVTAPLALLFLQSEQFRSVTASEVTRKLAHVRQLPYALAGDSLTAQWASAGQDLAGSIFGALNLGASGAVLSQITGQLENAARLKPQVLSIAAGTNDRLQGRSDDEILAGWDALILQAKTLPLQRVVVTAVPFPREATQDARLLALNVALRSKVEAAGWRFVDLNAAILAAPDRGALYQTDGLHFAPPIYALWAKALREP